MNKDNCVAYDGNFFRIEWYYDTNGNSQPFDYYNELSDTQKRKFLLLLKRMGDYGKINDPTKFTYEGDKVFAFKPQPDRFLSFFVKDKKIIITSAYKKKTQKLPVEEKNKALKCRKDYLIRNEEEKYYEKK